MYIMRYMVTWTWHGTTRVVDAKSKFQHIAIYHNAMTNGTTICHLAWWAMVVVAFTGHRNTFFFPSFVWCRIDAFSLWRDTHLRIYSGISFSLLSVFASNQWRISQYEMRDNCTVSLVYDAFSFWISRIKTPSTT